MWRSAENLNVVCLAGWTASVYSERGLAGERAREGKAAVLACGHQIEAEVARLQRRGILGGMVPGPSALSLPTFFCGHIKFATMRSSHPRLDERIKTG